METADPPDRPGLEDHPVVVAEVIAIEVGTVDKTGTGVVLLRAGDARGVVAKETHPSHREVRGHHVEIRSHCRISTCR